MGKEFSTEEWRKYNGKECIKVVGAFDMDKLLRRSVCRFDPGKGVLALDAYFNTGLEEWLDTGRMQRTIGPEIKRRLGADRSLCVVENLSHRRGNRAKDGACFVNVEYYAKLQGRPEPEKIKDMSGVITGYLENERNNQG